jgi:hypothetical protein
MHFTKETRDLARSLIASEAKETASFLQLEYATEHVYEKLRRRLSPFVGADGFRALAIRALVLAREESHGLSAVHIETNGGLRGLGEAENQTKVAKDNESGVIFIAQLLALLLAFLGETTTLRSIEELRLQTDPSEDSAPAPAETTDTQIERLVIAATFGDLLMEIDRLRSVSERIENLAEKHPGMERGLSSAAGNIRNIAIALDVFTLIRSKAEGFQRDTPNTYANGYMN